MVERNYLDNRSYFSHFFRLLWVYPANTAIIINLTDDQTLDRKSLRYS